MLKKLNWEAYSSDDRNKTIEETKAIISRNDGYIMNFNLFSDLALTLSIEIEEHRIAKLHEGLSQVLKVSDFDAGTINQESKKEWLIFLNISFTSGTGELKIKIPEVPG
jgi:hypothetical protein